MVPSVLWRCWLGGRKGIRPVKNLEWWGTGMVICLEWGADLHVAQLMPLPLTVSCFSEIQIGFTFLVPTYLGSPGKRAVKRVCVSWCMDQAGGVRSRSTVSPPLRRSPLSRQPVLTHRHRRHVVITKSSSLPSGSPATRDTTRCTIIFIHWYNECVSILIP